MREGKQTQFSFSTAIMRRLTRRECDLSPCKVRPPQKDQIYGIGLSRHATTNSVCSPASLGSFAREYTSPYRRERARERERNRVTSRECDLSPRIKDDVAQNYKRQFRRLIGYVDRNEEPSSPALPCREYRMIAYIRVAIQQRCCWDVANRNEISSHSFM